MAWKGKYNSEITYQNGDEVSFESGNVEKFFTYINASSSSGHAPSDNAYWAEASLVVYNADDTILKLLIVDDNSYRTRTIMGDQQVVIYFSSPTHVEIPIGAYIIYQNVRYILERPEALKMVHSRLFEYTITLEAYQVRAKRWKFRNPVDGRLKFPLTATPREHLQMFIDNMNRRDNGWNIGVCIDSVEHLISYDNAYCFEALQQIADEFDTEFEIVNKTVSLHKVEYNKNNPLPLSYGRGNGFKPNIGRSNSSDSVPVEILFTQGGEENIDKHTYGNSTLLLPINQTIGYDGEHFSDEDGYNSNRGRNYVSSSDGLSIQRSDKALSSQAEDSLDCTSIYPKRVGKVGQVITVDASTNFYDFTDKNDASDPCPNYEDYLIEGETMTVIFQSGMLAGREFDVKYVHNAVKSKGLSKRARRFEIVPQEIDGVIMPNETFKPAVNDTYVVFHCSMPQSYICNNASKSGASWTMFREAVKYLFEHEEQRFSFTGTLDGIWAKKDWVNIGGKIVLGGYISFTDERFQQEAVLVRIIGIKDYINNPHSPEITLSNETVTAGFSSEIKNLESTVEVIPEENYKNSVKFTKRCFRDAKETMKMLEASLVEGFTESISPVAAQMLQLLVGDESLQFRFVNNYSSQTPLVIKPSFSYNKTTGIFSVSGGYYLQHLSLGVNTLKSSHDASEYKWWSVQAYNSAILDDGSKKFYLYLKCPTASSCNCEYILSETAIKMNAVTDYYHLLVGVLNSEYDGGRSFTTLYGFTEITGGRVTTERIVSDDGNSFFDLVQKSFKLGDKLSFNTNGNGDLILNGAFVQTGNGDVASIGVWCGDYDALRVYKKGEEVTATVDGKKSTYRYVNDTPSKGKSVTETNYWATVAEGVKGDNGASMLFRGNYSSNTVYSGNDKAVDVVRYDNDGRFYVAKTTVGSIPVGTIPTNTEYWNYFGASFESVATNTLLADGAYIGDWRIKDGQIVSTLDNEKNAKVTLDATMGRITIDASKTGGLNPNLGANLILDSSNGQIRITAKNSPSYSTGTAYLCPNGIFANLAGMEAYPASSGITKRGAIVGIGFADVDKEYYSINGDETVVAGVVGRAQNYGTAQAFGGFFEKLKACGFILSTKYITDDSPSDAIKPTTTMIIGLNSAGTTKTVYLPTDTEEGSVFFVKQMGQGTLRIDSYSGEYIYDDNTVNEYYDAGKGKTLMFVKTKYAINGETKIIWAVGGFAY